MPFVLVLGDIGVIALSIVAAYLSRELFMEPNDIALVHYLSFFPLYVVPIVVFVYEGIYRYRYDFWQETRYILKALFLSFVIVFAYLALTRTVENYSRFVIAASFLFMALFIPIQKRFIKWLFFHIGWWKKEAKLYGEDAFFHKVLFENFYVGYVHSDKEAQTILVNAAQLEKDRLQKIFLQEIRRHHELLFIPILRDFNLSESFIYHLFNGRVNLILLTNRLASRRNLFIKEVVDRSGALVLTLLALPVMGVIVLALLFSSSPILYRQQRLGKDGRLFWLLKFRTMKPNADEILERYLQEHPEKQKEWEEFKKLKNYDPRVTKVGKFLRKYSLDELPQLFNVLKGEMSLVGPRPYIPKELEKLSESKEVILSVKPGITGLWQVLGRNDLSFSQRIDIDRWYVYNWSLWLDFVILLKTLRAIFDKDKAH